nr:PREDICTED: kxDL motif-containing protein 1 [Lepisosteus oculatus]
MEPTASGMFCDRMLSMVNSEDVNAIIQAQRHILFYLFFNCRTLKGKVAKQYPDAFSNVHESPILEDDDDEFDHIAPSTATTSATSEQSTESGASSPDIISPTASRCSEDSCQEQPDTPPSSCQRQPCSGEEDAEQ